MSQADRTEVEQGRRPGQQHQTGQQDQPRQEPDGHASQQPPLGHLAALGGEQGQLGGRVAADPTGLPPPDEQEQGVEDRQQEGGQEGQTDEGQGAPAPLLARAQEQEQDGVDQERGQILMAKGVEEHI